MSSKPFKTFLTTGLVIAVSLANLQLMGCSRRPDGPVRAKVSGTVNLDEEPLQEGVIRFIPDGETEGPQTTITITDGIFEAKGETAPIVGQHRIEIQSTDDGGYAMDDEQAIQRLREAGIKRIEVVRVPAAYNKNSKLLATVSEEGPNNYQFDLVTPTQKRR